MIGFFLSSDQMHTRFDSMVLPFSYWMLHQMNECSQNFWKNDMRDPVDFAKRFIDLLKWITADDHRQVIVLNFAYYDFALIQKIYTRFYHIEVLCFLNDRPSPRSSFCWVYTFNSSLNSLSRSGWRLQCLWLRSFKSLQPYPHWTRHSELI